MVSKVAVNAIALLAALLMLVGLCTKRPALYWPHLVVVVCFYPSRSFNPLVSDLHPRFVGTRDCYKFHQLGLSRVGRHTA